MMLLKKITSVVNLALLKQVLFVGKMSNFIKLYLIIVNDIMHEQLVSNINKMTFEGHLLP